MYNINKEPSPAGAPLFSSFPAFRFVMSVAALCPFYSVPSAFFLWTRCRPAQIGTPEHRRGSLAPALFTTNRIRPHGRVLWKIYGASSKPVEDGGVVHTALSPPIKQWSGLARRHGRHPAFTTNSIYSHAAHWCKSTTSQPASIDPLHLSWTISKGSRLFWFV